MRRLPVPRTPIAFRFLDPITEPIPPAECETEFITTDIGTRFSPACPMAATTASEPNIWESSIVARRIPCPQIPRAS